MNMLSKLTLSPIIYLGLIVLVSNACAPSRNKELADTTITDSSLIVTDVDTNLQEQAKALLSAWEYSEDEDKMTSKKTYFAQNTAKELLKFDFPYDGGSVATLTVRKKRGENNVYLQVSKGQFNSGVDGGNIRARFDSKPAKTYSFSQSSSNNSSVIFIDNEAGFIKNLKSHKQLFLEAEFYGEGNRIMEFDITGFKWSH
jgi:hypothetical protein